MDCEKVGRLIYSLRREKKLTQKQLADAMNISDKTISKWERGMGCPDVSLLSELSNVLEINIEKLLAGEINANNADGGNMKKTKLYVCPACGNVLTATGEADISCCGRRLAELVAKTADEEHKISAQEVEEDYYITFNHPMEKQHYISFFAYLRYDRVYFVKLYPEQGGELRLPQIRGGELYYYCTEHGLMKQAL